MTIKKTAVKKVTAKKSPSKRPVKNTKRSLICAQGEQCFWTTDGSVISNLVELEKVFAHMSDDVFTHHVHKERNDFANWIADILQDVELAQSLRTAKKPHTARSIVIRRLKTYEV